MKRAVFSSLALAVLALLCLVSPSESFGFDTFLKQATQKYAYASVYTHTSPDAESNLLAMRVLIKTVQRTGTKHDFVVLVSPDTPKDIQGLIKETGAVVKVIDGYGKSSLIHSSYYSDCPETRDLIFAWQLTDYARVVVLSPNQLVFLNLDDLFKCGHFCIQYMTIMHWTAGIMVIRPNLDEFSRLVTVFNQKAQRLEGKGVTPMTYHEDLRRIASGVTKCDFEHYDFLLTAYPAMEAAPLFPIDVGDRVKPFEEPAMRLNAMYQVNAIIYYEHFHWDLHRLNINIPQSSSAYIRQKQIAEITKNIKAGETLTIDMPIVTDIPTFTIEFVFPPPTSWLHASYFTLNWFWNEIRYESFPEETSSISHTFLLSRSLVLILMYVTIQAVFKTFGERVRKSSGASIAGMVSSPSGVAAPGIMSTQLKVQLAAFGIALFVSYITFVFFAFPFVPFTTPPYVAWFIFPLAWNLANYFFLRLFALFLNIEREPTFLEVLPSASMWWLNSYVIMKMDIFGHFVVKMIGGFFPFIGFAFILLMRPFARVLAEAVEPKGTTPAIASK